MKQQLISTKEDPETGEILAHYVFTPHSGYRVPSYFFTPQISKSTGELVELDSLHGNQQHNFYPGYDLSGGKIFQHIVAEFGKSLVKKMGPPLPEATAEHSKRRKLIATPMNWRLLLNASSRSAFVASVVTDSDSRTSRPTEFRTKCIVKPELVFEMGIHHVSKQNVEEYSPAAIAVQRREQDTLNSSARGHPGHPVHSVNAGLSGTAQRVNERWVAERAEVPLPAAFFVHYRKCLPPTFDLQCEERSRDRQMRDRFGARLRSLLSRRVALLAADLS